MYELIITGEYTVDDLLFDEHNINDIAIITINEFSIDRSYDMEVPNLLDIRILSNNIRISMLRDKTIYLTTDDRNLIRIRCNTDRFDRISIVEDIKVFEDLFIINYPLIDMMSFINNLGSMLISNYRNGKYVTTKELKLLEF